MEEKTYKIYDSMYNVIGVASYEEVHIKGLLHQVVHFWLAGKENDQTWLYIQKRPEEDPVYQGAYDILTSGHIDPEETHEEAIIHQIQTQLGLSLKKEQLTHIGHIHQNIMRGTYVDNAFVQIYLYKTDHPEKEFSAAERVLKVKLEDLKKFIEHQESTLTVYSINNEPFAQTDREQWWPRQGEFEKVVIPYMESHQ